MKNDSELTLNEALEAIKKLPYLREGFSSHLKWLFENCGEEKRYDQW